MKASLFSILAAAALLASSPSFAATPAVKPLADHRFDYDHYDHDGRNDRNSKDFNYGYDRNHRVSPQERAHWEAANRRENDRRDDRKDDGRNDRRDERNDKNFNYGYDHSHRVTPQERARWENAHRYDGRR